MISIAADDEAVQDDLVIAVALPVRRGMRRRPLEAREGIDL